MSVLDHNVMRVEVHRSIPIKFPSLHYAIWSKSCDMREVPAKNDAIVGNACGVDDVNLVGNACGMDDKPGGECLWNDVRELCR